MAAAFEYRQAEEIRDVFAAHGVRYLFIGKSGAILLGFPRYHPGRRSLSAHDGADEIVGMCVGDLDFGEGGE